MIVTIVICMIVALIISNYASLWYLNNARMSVPEFDKYAEAEDVEAGIPAKVPTSTAKKGFYVFVGCYFASLIFIIISSLMYTMSALRISTGIAAVLVLRAIAMAFNFKSIIVLSVAILVLYVFALGMFTPPPIVKNAEASSKEKLYALFLKLDYAKVSQTSTDMFVEDAMALYRNFGLIIILLVCIALFV